MSTCRHCGAEIAVGQGVVLSGRRRRDPTAIVCPDCVLGFEHALRAETENPNLVVAALSGIGAAVVGCLAWYAVVAITNYQLGFLAVGVGWLIGQAVVFGAGRKRGSALQAISVVITLLAMAFSQYLIVRHWAVEALAEEGVTDIPVALPVGFVIEIIVYSIKSDLLTLLFWAIAVWTAFSVPAKRSLRRAKV